MGWRNRPTYIDNWEEDIDYIMFIDESGNSNPKSIKKKISKNEVPEKHERCLTITGAIMNRKDFPEIREKTIELKNSFWPPDGTTNYKNIQKKVCLHTNEIRNKRPPFSNNEINYEKFMEDLTNYLKNDANIKIISSTIDIYDHILKYGEHALHPYSLALDFIIERFAKFFMGDTQKGIIVLEARGCKEDKFTLQHIKKMLSSGTNYATRNDLSKINAVYFNPKWCKKSQEKLSYFGLEIADLACYPISNYCCRNQRSRSFDTFENKIYGYPNYHGKGIKIFP